MNALFVGMGSYFEIWRNESLEEMLMSDEDFEKALQEKMGSLNF